MPAEYDNNARTYLVGSARLDWGAHVLNAFFEFLSHRHTHTEIQAWIEDQWRILCDRRDEELANGKQMPETNPPLPKGSGVCSF